MTPCFSVDKSVLRNKGLTVNALTLRRVAFVRADHNLIKRAVVGLMTVIPTLVNRTADTSVGFVICVHQDYLRKIIARTAETVRANIS